MGPHVISLEYPSQAAPSGQAIVHILGTAHVSQESCREVKALIQQVQPDVVFLELCSSRQAILQPPQHLPEPRIRDLVAALRNKQTDSFGVVYAWFLSKVAHKLEVLPGEEFRVAFEEGQKCGAKIQLGDRPVQVTLRRTWSRLSRWQRIRITCELFWQSLFLPDADEISSLLEEFQNGDLIEVAVKELGRTYPTMLETILTERDLYMTFALRETASRCSKVVAVVGQGHQAGILSNWANQGIDVTELLTMPPEPPPLISPWMKRWALLGLGATAVGFIYYVRIKSR